MELIFDFFKKVLEKGVGAGSIILRLSFGFYFVFGASQWFRMGAEVESIRSRLDVVIISNVVKVCLGTALFVVTVGGIVTVVALIIQECTKEKCGDVWGKVYLAAGSLAKHAQRPVELFVQIEVLCWSILLVIGEDINAVWTNLVPSGVLEGTALFVNGLVLLFAVLVYLNDVFYLSE